MRSKSIPDLISMGMAMFNKEERKAILDAIRQIDVSVLEQMFANKVEAYQETPMYAGAYDVGTVVIALLTGGKKLLDNLADFLKGGKIMDDIPWDDIQKRIDEVGGMDKDQMEKFVEELVENPGMAEAVEESAELIGSWKLLDDLGDDVVGDLKNDPG